MNDTIGTILNRHSTRAFDDRAIAPEDKAEIFKAISESPSAGNMQTYSVIEVRDAGKIEKLSVLCDNQPFIRDGKMVLLFVTNPLRWYDVYNMSHEDKLYPSEADLYLNYNDTLIAAQTSVIAAESLGIGSCYIGDIIENYEEIKALFGLPKYVTPVCLLVFGYKKKPGLSPKRFAEEDLFCVDEFSNDSLEAMKRKLRASGTEGTDKQAYEFVSRLFNRKMKSSFFAEMNRSFRLDLEEFRTGGEK